MTQGSRQAKQGTRRTGDRGVPAAELMRAKMELVAARERGEAGALTRMLQRYPGHAPALTEALLRSREGATLGGETQPELDFAEAVRLSTNMSEDEKARWLAE